LPEQKKKTDKKQRTAGKKGKGNVWSALSRGRRRWRERSQKGSTFGKPDGEVKEGEKGKEGDKKVGVERKRKETGKKGGT